MTAPCKPSQSCLGFLTVLENAEHGFLGGYLLLNAAGRPLEFHCTAPIRASRTQEILYGPTLRPFLFGEQIGQTLLTKSKLKPLVVCTDSESALAVRDFSDSPVVLVLSAETASPSSAAASQFQLAMNQVAVASGYSNDEQLIRTAWPAPADHLDLMEPFDRIREALNEAQRSARQAA
jgi:hypothetical protein